MKTSKIIFPFVFLCIYFAIVFHNVVPHFHSETISEITRPEAAHAPHHHHDHEHHRAHHSDHEETSWIDYILGLLGDLKHTDLGDDHFENFTAQSSFFDLDVTTLDLDDVNDDVVYAYSSVSIDRKKPIPNIGHPKIIYEQQSACSRPLRGPPSIS